ncbi:MAG: hypothetical protein IJW78_03440 [Clostridia bacterium]|nr:hypothetical protein [Clostridia bacterium]
MGFPKMSRQTVRTVTMPELAGGLNLRDSVSMIQDNQLTDGKNIWYKDAVLKTRPGMKGLSATHLFADTRDGEFTDAFAKSMPTDIRREIDRKVYRLFTAFVGEGFDERILFRLVSETDVRELPMLTAPDHAEDSGIRNYIVFEHQQVLYCWITAGRNLPKRQFGWKLEKNASEWVEIPDEDYHIPLVAINGNMNHVFADPTVTRYEGYNILRNRYRMQFHADSAEPTVMRYVFARKLQENRDKLTGQAVIARLTDKDGNVITHTVKLTAEIPSWEESAGEDGLLMAVWDKNITFYDKNKAELPVPESYTNLKNNFELELPFWDEEPEITRAKLFNMTKSIWFGGASEGINGGTRLFLCGNTDEKEKNLVLWSDLNNPLYFPENNYFRVGDSAQLVTGFARQNEMLVIFKERESYYTYYKEGTQYDASDEIPEGNAEVTSTSAYFPLVQIHSSIGCDCPNSIQLCRNRLVWTNRNGKVYTLITNSQYSERNIHEISGMVERRLKQEQPEDLVDAFSCDWQGMYCLFVKNHVYLMDYNSYGYQYAASYSKTEDSNIHIPWWYWELPDFNAGKGNQYSQIYALYAVDNSMALALIKMLETETEESGNVRFYYEEVYAILPDYKKDKIYLLDTETIPLSRYNPPEIQTGKEQEISTLAQTKIFDFSEPHKNKSINLVNISFGNNAGKPMFLKYITENGEYPQELIRLRHNDTTEYSAGYVRNKPLRPCVGLTNRFGICLECEGNMAIDAISINYKLTGGAK